MNERTALRFALLASGLALAISLFGLWRTKTIVSSINDHELRLEAENAKLKATIDQNRAEMVQMLAREEMQLCLDLGGGAKCGQNELAGDEPEPFPDSVVTAIGFPKTAGDEIHVTIPAEVAKAILSQAERLAAEGGMLPAVKEGKPVGFELVDLREGGVGPAMGLMQGDVITAINGNPVRDTGELAAAWADVPGAKAWTIDFLRKLKPMKLVIETGTK